MSIGSESGDLRASLMAESLFKVPLVFAVSLFYVFIWFVLVALLGFLSLLFCYAFNVYSIKKNNS